MSAIPRVQLAVALLVALVTAMVGNWLSRRVAPPRPPERRLTALDRRAAEGFVNFDQRDEDALPSLPPRRILTYKASGPVVYSAPQRRTLAAAKPRKRVAPAGKTPSPAPRPSTIVNTVPATPGGPGPSAPNPSPSSAGALLGWDAVSPAVAVILAGGRQNLGVVLAPDLVVTAYEGLGTNPPVTLLDGHADATLVAADPRLGLAVLKLNRPPPATARLSEFVAPPGVMLSYVVANTALPSQKSEARVASVEEKDGLRVLHFSGLAPREARGGPLVAGNGTVAGIVLGRGWELPGGSLGLAASADAVRTLLAQTSAPEPAGDLWLRELGRTLVTRALPAPPSDRQSTNGIVPGVRLGPHYVGVPQDEGVPSSAQARPLSEGFTLFEDRGSGMGYVVVDGRIAAVLTNRGQYGTSNGAGVGMRLDQLDLGILGDLAWVRDTVTGETAVTAEGIELIADPDGRITEVHVLPRGFAL